MNFDYMGAEFDGNLAAATIFVGVTFPFFGALLGFFGGFAFAPTTYFVSLCFHLVGFWSQYKKCSVLVHYVSQLLELIFLVFDFCPLQIAFSSS
jgi:hypothetical protein